MSAVEHTLDAPPGEEDQRVTLHGVSWDDYELMLRIRGDHGGVRMTYLEGELELMSPSINHEGIKKTIARLLEAYGDAKDLPLNGYGSWTVRSAPKRRGVEADECYMLGSGKNRPDLAIEVIWTSGGLDKLEVYRGLGVPELWLWKGQHIAVHVLRGDHYIEVDRSELLPEIDLALLLAHVDPDDQTGSVRAYRKALAAP